MPRYIFKNLSNEPEFIELHGFCDASESAYEAVIYVRVDSKSESSVNLLCAKSRIPSIKPQTIPRLELCNALLLANLSIKF